MNIPEDTSKLTVLVAGGGPVGLCFALTLHHLLKDEVTIKIYDHRWEKNKTTGAVEWKNDSDNTERNRRREQVVTIQSAQYLSLPKHIRDIFFNDNYVSLMWPLAQAEIDYPRNIRISDLEDQLLLLANAERDAITLLPSRFNAKSEELTIKSHDILAICEGASSATRTHFEDKFGKKNDDIFSLDRSQPLQDSVLGLKVRTSLSSATVVALTISQNRFLLNMRNGEGYLNMRLTDEEAKEVKGFRHGSHGSLTAVPCIQQDPCVMIREGLGNDYKCPTHGAVFFPARDEHSVLMPRIKEGLKLFGINEEELEKITMWRLSMSSNCRFTTELYPGSGVMGALLGDAANTIHFWPGRGLNSGIASAVSLARCLEARMSLACGRRGARLSEADFIQHEGIMAQLQYRHKSRAWKAMVRVDDAGRHQAIKDRVNSCMMEKDGGVEALVERCQNLQTVVENENMGEQKEIQELPGRTAIVQLIGRLQPLCGKNVKISEILGDEMKEIGDSLVIMEERIHREAMRRRVVDIARGLIRNGLEKTTDRRMPQEESELRSVETELTERLNAVNADTLRALYFSEPWDTRAVAGPEVDVGAVFPDSEIQRKEDEERSLREREKEKRREEEIRQFVSEGRKWRRRAILLGMVAVALVGWMAGKWLMSILSSF